MARKRSSTFVAAAAALSWGLFSGTPVLAAQYSGRLGSAVVTLRTGTIGGHCTLTDRGAYGVDGECMDGPHRAVANSLEGCIRTEGRGLCAMAEWVPAEANASAELSCANGSKYNLGTGDDEGSCKKTQNGMTCQSTEPDGSVNLAKASCDEGCTQTTGSGCCCSVGSPGCGAGSKCTGK
jgi:hypothetical protein